MYAVITAISYLPSVSNYYIAVHIEDNQENSFEVLENRAYLDERPIWRKNEL